MIFSSDAEYTLLPKPGTGNLTVGSGWNSLTPSIFFRLGGKEAGGEGFEVVLEKNTEKNYVLYRNSQV